MKEIDFKFHDELEFLIKNFKIYFNFNWFNLHHPYIKKIVNNKRVNKKQKFEESNVELNSLILKGLSSLSPFNLTNTQYFDHQPLNKFSHHTNIGIDWSQFEDLIKLVYKFDESNINSILLSSEELNSLDIVQVFHHLIINPTDKVATLTINNLSQNYLIPPYARFIMSDLEFINDCLIHKQANFNPYDLIIMDPPWFNHSIKRSKHYKGRDKYSLLNIKMKTLLNPKGILAIWITNQPSIYKFVTNKLFPHWKLKLIGKWYWIKVTTQGELVIPLDHGERKPYEILLFATNESNDQLTEIKTELIYSVPFQYHSRKPNFIAYLSNLIKHTSLEEMNRLELFGRYLTPYCTTWGNEAIKFQNEYFLD